jgi:hypothetical protein
MKIKLSKKALKFATDLAVVGSGKSEDESMDKFFVFRPIDGSTLELLSYKGPIGTSFRIGCEILDLPDEISEQDFFAIEAKRLKKWLGAAGDQLEFEKKDRGVGAWTKQRSIVGRITFPLMGTEEFPWWDDKLRKAKKTAQIETHRLIQMLNHAKVFVGRDQQLDARTAVCEFRTDEESPDKARLYTMDFSIMSVISGEGLEQVRIRSLFSSIQPLIAFLSRSKEEEITILEEEGSFFLKAGSCLIKEARPNYDFPEISIGSLFEDAEHWWSFNKEEFRIALVMLDAGAGEEEGWVWMELEGDRISLQASHGRKKLKLKLDCLGIESSKGAKELGPFRVSREKFSKLLDALGNKVEPPEKKAEEDTETEEVAEGQAEKEEQGVVKMAILDMGRGEGYIAFKEQVGKDSFLSILGWYGED